MMFEAHKGLHDCVVAHRRAVGGARVSQGHAWLPTSMNWLATVTKTPTQQTRCRKAQAGLFFLSLYSTIVSLKML